jgi:hypothetical protein
MRTRAASHSSESRPLGGVADRQLPGVPLIPIEHVEHSIVPSPRRVLVVRTAHEGTRVRLKVCGAGVGMTPKRRAPIVERLLTPTGQRHDSRPGLIRKPL